MNTEDESRRTRRIVVAMDASLYGRQALDSAVLLAALLRAELQGLFVEDSNLLRAARLPQAQEVCLSLAAPRPLDTAAVERRLRVSAERLRRALAASAERGRVTWSFEVARGEVVQICLAAAGLDDLLVLGKDNPAPHTCFHRQMPATRRTCRKAAVVQDGTPGSQRAVEAAAALAAEHALKLVLVVPDAAVAERHEPTERSVAFLRDSGVPFHVHREATVDVRSLVCLARRCHLELLFLARQGRWFDDADLERLVNELDCPVALVP